MSKRVKKARLKQLHFDHKRHGGWRERSGRKKGDRVSHGRRPDIGHGDVGLITINMKEGLRSLRYHAEFDAIYDALFRAREACRVGEDFRIIEITVQSNHLHLIVEAESNRDLETGMRGFMACLGNSLRALWGIQGGIFADRYHLEIITTPTQMRNAYGYVLNNARKHNCWEANKPDRYSSGGWSGCWSKPIAPEDRPRRPSPCSAPRSWLASKGWLRAGPKFAFSYTPRKRRRTRRSPVGLLQANH